MTHISPWTVAPPIIFLSIATIFAFGLLRENPNTLPSVMIGKAAPTLVTEPIGNLNPVTKEMMQTGELKLVNFWASWCGPCRAEHPNLTQLAKNGLPVLGLNFKDTDINALRFLQELGNPYDGVSSIDGRQSLEWGVYGVPETFLLDRNGKILYRATGPITQRVIREQLTPIMNEVSQ